MKKVNFFGKKLPAWMLLAALIIVGAGAATGLVLKDQINGTTTIAVSKALIVDGAPEAGSKTVNNDPSMHDEFLGTANDDGTGFAAHFEANNGDRVVFLLPLKNEGEQTIVEMIQLDIPEGITVKITEDPAATCAAADDQFCTEHADESKDITNIVQISPNTWKFEVPGTDMDDTTNDRDGLIFFIAIEDAQPTGFYELSGTIVPMNV